MKPILFAPAAQAEFEAAAEWYESHSEGLGGKFTLAIDTVVNRIHESPSGFPIWDGDRRFRRAIVRRFPYILFYRETPDTIEVLAVAHAARDPGYWLKRK